MPFKDSREFLDALRNAGELRRSLLPSRPQASATGGSWDKEDRNLKGFPRALTLQDLGRSRRPSS